MKTPEEIIYQYFYSFPDGHEEDIIKSMKEYAKQWVDRSVEIADMNIDADKIHSRISALSKEIDAQ